MLYHFDTMVVNGEHVVRVQNGVARPYTESVLYWMGSPPSPAELEPKSRLDLKWQNMLAPEAAQLDGEFRFEISTHEGAIFVGTALIPAPGVPPLVLAFS